MSLNESEMSGNGPAKPSRRNFLKSAAAIAVAGSGIACGQQGEVKSTREAQRAQPSGKPRLVYVGSYSSLGPEGELPAARAFIFLKWILQAAR